MTEPDRAAAFRRLPVAPHRGGKRLTPRQAAVLDFIVDHTAAKGYPPTIREIGAAVGIPSTNGINDHLNRLVAKGCLERSGVSKSRGLRVLSPAKPAGLTELAIRMPDDWVPKLEAAAESCGLEVEEMARRALRAGLTFAVAETKADRE